MLKAVIFDMDGVLIDSEIIYYKLDQLIYRDLGINVTDEEHYSYVGTTSDYMWGSIRKKHNLLQSVDELIALERKVFGEYLVGNANEILACDGVIDFIKDLKKHNICLAIGSSSPIALIEAIVKLLKIDEYFDVLVSGEFVENSKPHPDIFIEAAKRLNIDVSNCCVVEDAHNGVTAANSANIYSLGYQNPHSGNQDLSHSKYIFSNFNDINYEFINQLLVKEYNNG